MFVEFFVGEEDPLHRYERMQNQTPYLKMNAEGKMVVEAQKLRNVRIASLQSYLIFQERLEAWACATGRWTPADVLEHRHWVHAKIVPFAATYSWVAVMEYDHNFRVSQHLGTLSWTDDAVALVQAKLMPHSKAVASALADLRSATKKAAKTQPAPRKTTGAAGSGSGRVDMVNMKTEAGDEICISFQLGKCTGACGRKHVCHKCRRTAATCACTDHKRGPASAATSTGSSAQAATTTISAPTASLTAASNA